jgi:hypothetical protein
MYQPLCLKEENMKTVNYEHFGYGQDIYFNIGRLAMVENVGKCPIGEIISQNYLNLNHLAVLLSVGLSHHQKRTPAWYLDKIQELLDSGMQMEEISEPVYKALAASGIMGKEIYYAFFPEELTEETNKKLAEIKK